MFRIFWPKKGDFHPPKHKSNRVDQILVELVDRKQDKLNMNEVDSWIKEDNDVELVGDDERVDEKEIMAILSQDQSAKVDVDPTVKKLLQTYKPKIVDLTLYLKLDKLKGYNYIGDFSVLIAGETYVKYILTNDAFSNKEYKKHVHCGGVFLLGGTFVNGHFNRLEHLDEWTHIMLKRTPYPVGLKLTKKGYGYENVYDYDIHNFTLKINSYYFFYKYFDRKG